MSVSRWSVSLKGLFKRTDLQKWLGLPVSSCHGANFRGWWKERRWLDESLLLQYCAFSHRALAAKIRLWIKIWFRWFLSSYHEEIYLISSFISHIHFVFLFYYFGVSYRDVQPFITLAYKQMFTEYQFTGQQCWASYSKNVIYYSLLVTPFKSNIVTLLITFWQQ